MKLFNHFLQVFFFRRRGIAARASLCPTADRRRGLAARALHPVGVAAAVKFFYFSGARVESPRPAAEFTLQT